MVPPNDELTSLIDLHGNHLRKVLRFPIGAQVECRLGEDKWLPGKVTGHRYRQKEWPENRRAPYQVQIDGDGPEQPGPKIFVPQDSDDCVRTAASQCGCRADGTEWHPRHQRDGSDGKHGQERHLARCRRLSVTRAAARREARLACRVPGA